MKVSSYKSCALAILFLSLAGFWGLAAVSPLYGQVDAGRVTGTVLDASDAPAAGVTVTIRNTRTGETRETTTTEDGSFLVTALKASFYTITVAKAGFTTDTMNGVQVTVGQEIHRNFKLQVAAVAETVTVTSSADAAVDTTSARIGVNVTEREVEGLPLNGRQISQLYLQAPGALNSGTGTFQDIHFSGRALDQNAIRYDGVEGGGVVDTAPGNLNGEVASPFRLQSSLENVQEFRAESNNYPAEYGTGDGGQISIVTKSGSNSFHGSGYEYLRNDALDAKNYFDLPNSKSKLRLNQFGGSLGGPLVKDKVFFFGYYEGYRLRAGINNIESVPSSRIRALPACGPGKSFPGNACVDSRIQPLLPGFIGPGTVLIQPDTSSSLGNSSLDVYLLPGLFTVNENSAGARFDYHINDKENFYIRYFRDQGDNHYPEGVTGRNVAIRAVPQNGAISLASTLSNTVINQFTFGFNEALTRINGSAPTINGVDFSAITINTSGSIASPGIPGQGNSAGLAVPGGLVRANSATNGRGAPYTPYSLSFIDNLSWTTGIHSLKFGTEVRLIRMYTDRLGGTTYTFSNLTSFLNDSLSTTDDLVDVSAPSPYNNGATGNRLLKQEYYIGYAEDEMRLRKNLTLNLGLRYEYYSVLREDRNLYVLLNLNDGTLYSPNFCQNPFAGLQAVCTPKNAPWYNASPSSFGPRIGIAWSPFSSRSGLFGGDRTLIRGGFGIYYGPGQVEDTLQPAESDRIWTTPSGGAYCGPAITCATSAAALSAAFVNPANLNNRSARVRAYTNDYTVPERIYQYSGSWQQQWGGRFVSTIAYVGSKGRNLFLRNIGNRIVSVRTNTVNGSAITVRQFDIDQGGNTVLHPYAEVDYKTGGGYDSYNALQTQLLRRFNSGLSLSAQYTFSKSYGDSGGTNEALTASDPYDYNVDNGYNLYDVRHNFNVSALYQLPFERNQSGISKTVLGNWEVGTIVNARSGVPVPVQITRPDVVFRGLPGTAIAGQIFSAQQLSGSTILTEAIINTPGGGNTRNVRRPDVVPGVPQFLPNGFLNPAAFAVPQPGTFGNLIRNSVHGPGFAQADLIVAKKFPIREALSLDFRAELYNIFNHPNFANPPAQLGSILPSAPGQANTAQPGQAYTASSAGAFGKIVSTVGNTVGIGTNRQIQFALRLSF